MRIAHVVLAAATMARRGQLFGGPSRARARLASKARPGGGSLPRAGAASSAGQPRIGARYALWPVCLPHEFACTGASAPASPAFFAAASAVPNVHC